MINSLLNDKFWDLTKAFADAQLTLPHNHDLCKKKSFENILGKSRKYWYEAFSPFPTMFLAHTSMKLEWSKILSFAKEFNVAKAMISVDDGVENIVGKGEYAGDQT